MHASYSVNVSLFETEKKFHPMLNADDVDLMHVPTAGAVVHTGAGSTYIREESLTAPPRHSSMPRSPPNWSRCCWQTVPATA
jgi:hypothetical protein